MLKAPWLWMLAVLWGWAMPAHAAQPVEPMPLLSFWVGTQRVISLPPEVRGFEVRDKDMLEVLLLGPRQLLVIGQNEGKTELLLYGRHGPIHRMEVRLTSSGCTLMICGMCRLLPEGTTIKAGSFGAVAALLGVAHTLEEARAVRLIKAEYPNVQLRVQLTERALRAGLMRVNHELWRAGFLDARAIVMGDRVLLTGSFRSDADETRARATIAPYVAWLEERLGLPVLAPTL
jgi:hypothetical protein